MALKQDVTTPSKTLAFNCARTERGEEMLYIYFHILQHELVIIHDYTRVCFAAQVYERHTIHSLLSVEVRQGWLLHGGRLQPQLPCKPTPIAD
eukprot:5550502-Amphidinium_carterae.1